MSKVEADRALDRSRRLAANLTGRRESLDRRFKEVAQDVRLSKGRALARPEQNAILEAVQAKASEQTVGGYSRMLSALARDILGGQIEIGLDLYTERGAPALDIFEHRNGRRADIMENCSGSLTNVVCMGLRAIATARSQLRQFLVFDEPDCWMEDDKAPAVFEVLSGLAERLKVQILVISHHSLSSIGVRANVVEVAETPGAGLRALVRPGARGWDGPSQVGLRHVRLKDFDRYADVTFPLSPGLNVVIGANNVGKSRLTRALRSVAYGGGDSSDEDIRQGAKGLEVEIGMEGDRVLSFSRFPKRNPVSLWSLKEADGRVVDLDGTHCEEGGRNVPLWVAGTLGIAKVDGLDIQMAHQKLPVFLLDRSPSQRAMVLSVDGEAGYLRDMIAMSKEDKARDAAAIKTGEAELARLQDQLAGLETLDGLEARIEAAAAAGATCGEALEALRELEEILAAMEEREAALARCRAIVTATADLPTEPDVGPSLRDLRDMEGDCASLSRSTNALTRARQVVAATEALPEASPTPPALAEDEALVERLAEGLAGLERARRTLAVLDALPEAAPAVPETDAMEADAARLAASLAGLEKARREADEAARAAAEIALEISDDLAGLGNLCPLCGTPGIGHDHVLSAEAV